MGYQTFELYADDMPGFNETIKAAMRRGKNSGVQGYTWFAKKWINKVQDIIEKENIYPIDKIFLHMIWIEKNKKRDPDNIASFIKFILDGLQKAKVIKNDGWGQVAGWKNEFITGEKRGVMVKIYDAETL